MAKVSRTSADEHIEAEGFEGHYGQAEDVTVGFETYTADADLTPFFVGLPDDRCQARHWGYVVRGKVVFHTAAGDEAFETGDAYAVGPGHTPTIYAGTEVVEFSPTDEFAATMEVVGRNMENAG
jgi:hypothetical protein